MIEQAKKHLQEFADKHNIIFDKKGTVGFERPCVGLSYRNNYIDHNPYDSTTYDPIEKYEDERLYPPSETPNAYHKHDCLAVLVHGDNYDKAIIELYHWIKNIEAQGAVHIVSYATGETGLQALFTGTSKKCIVLE